MIHFKNYFFKKAKQTNLKYLNICTCSKYNDVTFFYVDLLLYIVYCNLVSGSMLSLLDCACFLFLCLKKIDVALFMKSQVKSF